MLAVASVTALPAAAPAKAVQDVASQRAALEARVAAVRAALPEAAAEPSWAVAQQAPNWTNWPKWSKWANWANK